MVRANRAKLTRSSAHRAFLLAAVLGSAAPAWARDKGPELPPMACPIEGTLRVASAETLKHFVGLLGNCAAETVVVSPATTVNRPRGDVRTVPIGGVEGDGPAEPAVDGAASGFTLARASGKDQGKPPALGVRVERSADRSRVAIIPPTPPASPAFIPAAIPSGSPLAAPAIPLHADPDADAEAILALRPRSYATAFDEQIAAAARRHGVDPLLLHAVITQESRYKPSAVSHAGARGLMQVMPQTGRGLGVADARHLFDPATNIDAGARFLKQLWVRLDGRMDLVLAAYNAGEGAVRRYGMQVPPFRETRDYVVKVKAIYARLASESGLLAVLD